MNDTDREVYFRQAASLARAGARCGHSPMHDGKSCGEAAAFLVIAYSPSGLVGCGVVCVACSTCPLDEGPLTVERRRIDS